MTQYTQCLGGFVLPIYDRTLEGTLEVIIRWNGDDLTDVASRVMNNGSVMGFISEGIAARIYSQTHDHVPTKGYDLATKNPKLSLNLECKTATAGGCKLAPSGMYGKGRKYDDAVFKEETPNKDFFIADTAHAAKTGILRFVVKRGVDVVDIGHSLSRKRADKLFEANKETKL